MPVCQPPLVMPPASYIIECLPELECLAGNQETQNRKREVQTPHSTESGISYTELGESGNTQEHIQQESRIRELPDSVQETPGLQATGMEFMSGTSQSAWVALARCQQLG